MKEIDRKKCRRVRRELAAPEPQTRNRLSSGSTEHLRECPSCSAFSERMDAAVGILREHRVEVTPDAGFARRVGARLPGRNTADLGWAAARLAPVGLALALTLGVWCWLATVPPSQVFESSQSEDLLTWVLVDEEADQ